MKKDGVVLWLSITGVVLMAIVVARLFFLTVVLRGYYKDLAERNILRLEKVEPNRGVILDRNNKPIALNVDVSGRMVRHYPFGEVFALVTGYLGRGDTPTLEGKMGLEKEYELRLSGKEGEVLMRQSADGEEKAQVTKKDEMKGENLVTNLDSALQVKSFVALKEKLKETGKSGAIVIAKVSGEVLSLVSVPSFDSNLFVEGGKRSDFGGDYKDIKSLLNDEEKKPLFNRVISGTYAPGSVYKLLPAIASLEEKKIKKDTVMVDTGEIKVGEYRFGNWFLDKYGKTEGELDVERALARSNDVFFYRLGEYLGADGLIAWTKKFGMGEKTGVDLPGEVAGFVPTPLWREKTLGERWYLGNTYHMSIGQGDLMTTPMQINRLTAGVVSGKKCEPRLVGGGKCVDLSLGHENISTVLEGMKQACSPGGTAYPLFPYAGKIYCKTGTAQKGGEETLPNAWISVVVPKGASVDDWLVLTVLIEEGGEGSSVAGPVAKEILESLL